MNAPQRGAAVQFLCALMGIQILATLDCALAADTNADLDQSIFSLRGFGTLGVVHSSDDQAAGTYRPDVEWANIKFQVTSEFDIRAGRIVLHTFMYSDSLNVGYALPYVRTALEVYGELPVGSSDGIDGVSPAPKSAATVCMMVPEIS